MHAIFSHARTVAIIKRRNNSLENRKRERERERERVKEHSIHARVILKGEN